MERKPLTSREKYDKIITDRLVFGKTVKQIMEEQECSNTFVFNILAVFNATKEQDWNRAQALIANQNVPLSAFEWAAERIGVTLPPILSQVYEERKKRIREKAKNEYSKTAEIPARAIPDPETAVSEHPKPDNSGLYMIKLLEAINKQNELLEQFMDVVVPKYIQDLKDSINANSDMLRDGIKDCKDTLEGIKINTRKRGL